ncbi:MAG TPA: RagB/SusD family nutrient uptake outer membrane protein [Chitinophagaceae bacterium]|nr:RagB/SusD family nutrient uptake outer membrane protein [Chitinophagaceae bacterium]
MKKKNKFWFSVYAGCVAVLILGSCKKQLIEEPHTVFTTSFFQTLPGIQAARTTLYSGMRYNYGPEPTLAITVMGTDEFTGADQVTAATGGQYVRSFALYGGTAPIQASDGSLLNQWNNNFNLINLANAVITYTPAVNADTATKVLYLAEAHFLRGLYYLNLVQQFGAVPVDLGSGDLQFNQTAYTGFNRLPVDSTLAKDYSAMIADFTYASQNLPDQRPANAFYLAKPIAFLMLARVYIYHGYSSQGQPSDFQNAYNAAMEVINNQGKYGVALQQDYGKVYAQGNDYNSEILWSVERLPGDNNDNEVPNQQNAAGKNNDAAVDFAPNYTDVAGAKSPGVGRQTVYGRPIRRFAPTRWLWDTCFADKYNDSRFDNSFRMMWFTNQGGSGNNGGAINYGDTAFVLAVSQAQADSFNALPGRAYGVVPPSKFWTLQNNDPEDIYPYLNKFSDSLKSNFNDFASGRPFVVGKLSELYLLAAEAAYKNGDANTAANLINVLRTRAAWRPDLSPSEIADRAAAIQVSPPQINVDFILDERTRELCGEGIRWPDLAMRGKLVERVQEHNPDGGPNIQSFHVLRPIPQSQLDAVTTKDPAYQNPGY